MMPIDTRLDGNPGSLHAGAQWLRDRLGFEVDASAASLRSAGEEAQRGWHGTAGTTFAGRMSEAAVRADGLSAEVTATATTFAEYGDTLAAAQALMESARQVAAGSSLRVLGPTIMEPLPPPPDPSGAAIALYNRQVVAFQSAAQQVTSARTQMAAARSMAQARQAQAVAQPLLDASAVLNSVSGAFNNTIKGLGEGTSGAAQRDARFGGASGAAAGGLAGGLQGGASSSGTLTENNDGAAAPKPSNESAGQPDREPSKPAAEPTNPGNSNGGAEKPAPEPTNPGNTSGGAEKPAAEPNHPAGGAAKPAESVNPGNHSGGAEKPAAEPSNPAGGAAKPADSSLESNARTKGGDVAFAPEDSRNLAAHELTHVVQQRGAAPNAGS